MYLHGGDYNPEQWIQNFETVIEDIAKLKQANINTVTLGMFNWSMLEPSESEFDFTWLEKVLDELEKNQMYVILGTPTAARPHWLAQKYPETSRINKQNIRELSGSRHNHCMSSPIFRIKAELIINKLIELSKKYSNIHSWHINNEFGGDCFCEHCQAKFRNYLKDRYGTIENLNQEWWNVFWSHRYTSFEEIIPPFEHGEQTNTALKINWSRFATYNHLDYYLFEKSLLNNSTDLPVTTNFHGEQIGGGLDYYEFAKHVDYISFDIYPQWDTDDNYRIAIDAKTNLLIQASLDKEKDFYIMESSPGSTNWQDYTILKTAKLHEASTYLQMLAGSKSFLYFQLKQSRGSSEKYHGAVLDINSNTNSRVYKYVSDFGSQLKEISKYSKAKMKKEVAIYFSWDNTIMLDHSEGPRNKGLYIREEINKLVEYFNNVGLNAQFVFDESDLEQYDTVIFPYAYTVKSAVIEKLKKCENKNVIAFPLLNYVNDDDLLNVGALPYKLSDCFGIEVEEVNVIIDGATVASENLEYHLITEVVQTVTAKQIEKFNHPILKSAITLNEYNGTNFYYIAGMLTQESLIACFDKIFNTQYQVGKKIIESNLVLDGIEYQYLINFGTEDYCLSNKDIQWSTGDYNKLKQYEFAINKK